MNMICGMIVSEGNYDQQVEELLDVYASSLRHLSNESIVAMHRENVGRHAVALCEITRKELDWRGLLLGESCLCSN